MKIPKGLTLVVAATAFAFAAPGNAAGPPAESHVYTVGSLTVPGVETGLVLKKGKPVTVTATGVFCPGTGFCSSPDGNSLGNSWDTTWGGFVLPGAPAYGLVARVGDGPWVHVGSGPTKLSGKGVLVFAVNDDLFPDNTGGFTATVSTKATGPEDCYPGFGSGDPNHEHCGPPGNPAKPPPPGRPSLDSPGNGKRGT
jgi:hypothetical protein